MKHLSWQAKALIVDVIFLAMLQIANFINLLGIYGVVGDSDKAAAQQQLHSSQVGNKIISGLITLCIISAVILAILEYRRAMRKK